MDIEINSAYLRRRYKACLRWCIFLNLFIGNIGLTFFESDIYLIGRIVTSVLVALWIVFLFSRFVKSRIPLSFIKAFLLSGLLLVTCMLIVSICFSVTHLAGDEGFLAAFIKGILPTSLFALFFGFVFWFPIFICNFLYLLSFAKADKTRDCFSLIFHFLFPSPLILLSEQPYQ